MSNSERVMLWRNKVKTKLIEYKGGCCVVCGYNKTQYPRAFHFHHLDGQTKDFGLGGKNYSWERMKQEADKCVLMCSRCHDEYHDDLVNQQRAERLLLQRQYLSDVVCKGCGSVFKPVTSKAQYCCVQCARQHKRKVQNAPTKEELLQLVLAKNNSEIAQMYHITESAVRKWRKKHGICVSLAQR